MGFREFHRLSSVLQWSVIISVSEAFYVIRSFRRFHRDLKGLYGASQVSFKGLPGTFQRDFRRLYWVLQALR